VTNHDGERVAVEGSENALSTLILLEPIEFKTAAEAVAQKLIGLFNNAVLKPGDRLPPERELAARLGVGRTTVREALKLLTLSGLLEAKRGSGTYVRADYSSFVANQVAWPALLNAQDVEVIFEVRAGLEVQAASLAAERASDAEIARIAEYRDRNPRE
jgi:GntR family transcriptional repressor for pyruvate dehydrogenase complex